MSIQWNAMSTQRSSNAIHVNSMKFKFDSISIQCQFIFNIQLQFNEFQIKCKASWFLQSTADLIHTGITLFQLFSPFAGKMEKQLWSLAAFLGECSRIVSQVLDSSDSSSNGNVTQILPANSRRTASNVSSAIERAQSMLERSRNRSEGSVFSLKSKGTTPRHSNPPDLIESLPICHVVFHSPNCYQILPSYPEILKTRKKMANL